MSEGKEALAKAVRESWKTGWKTGVYSDLVIKCGEYSFNVHKIVVCAGSARRLSGMQEGDTGVIELLATSDSQDVDEQFGTDDPETVKLMIDYLYLHDYEAPAISIDPEEANEGRTRTPRLTPSGDCNVVMHAEIYSLGSKYHIDLLKAAALRKFSEAAMYAWNGAQFVDAIRLVYTTTPGEDRPPRHRSSSDHRP
ncbi:hypothetical protein LTR85_002320 [Meristemomyces frigidus]|nr:hypothetical protein LTR85_002320 [Meristemomyces frigidus]